jgi:hypothetical protein
VAFKATHAGLEKNAVLPFVVGMAMGFRIEDFTACNWLLVSRQGEANLLRLRTQIMHAQDGIVAPFISHRQDAGVFLTEGTNISTADLGDFAHTNEAFHPVQQRVGSRRWPGTLTDGSCTGRR